MVFILIGGYFGKGLNYNSKHLFFQFSNKFATSFVFQTAMSCPNNVRKVMNVEISSRLNENKAVIFINNDIVLEWWKDDVKKMRLFNSDGHHLTAYGFSVMLDHWMVRR